MNTANAKTPSHTNHLIKEKSPYLLQHAHNPVNWYAWGEKAFDAAEKEQKPIFLSIGYSTCHWCHVMERESFENEEIADYLNEHFISIKVDREERPDIDQIYMKFVVATTGSGGWPMSVFLLPDRKPFYGGTYFPPTDQHGRPGFMTVLKYLTDAWKDRRDEIQQSGNRFVEYMDSRLQTETAEKFSNEGTLRKAFRTYLSNFDSVHGGFSGAPKFPSGHSLSFLMRYHKRYGDEDALKMVEKTLDEMAYGGIRDHIDGGFHRYSVDKKWFVPHFEKMLYDQANLLRAYVEAYQLTGKPLYEEVIREVADYVIREMQSEDGGFYSALDADSLVSEDSEEKKEGAFYVWEASELKEILSEEEYSVFKNRFGIEDDGNVGQDPHGEFENKNVLSIQKSIEDISQATGKDIPVIQELLASSRKKVSEKRGLRPKPYLDDKVLTDWNGFMMGSLAMASLALNEPRYKEASLKAGNFVLNNLLNSTGDIVHRWRDGEAAIQGQLDDYAYLIHGFIQLYELSYEEKWLKHAKDFTDRMIWDFWDNENFGFYMTSHGAGKYLITRPKEFQDGAIPSGNSMALLNLLLMERITQVTLYQEKIQSLWEIYGSLFSASATSFAQALIALDYSIGPSMEIVIVGDDLGESAFQMKQAMYSQFLPNKVVIFHSSEKIGQPILDIASFVAGKTMIQGEPTAYVCRNYVCQLPTNDLEQFKKQLLL